MICEGEDKFQLPLVQPIYVSSLDISMASFGDMACPSFDLLNRSSSSSVIPSLAFPPPLSISDMDKSLTADIATNAMDKLVRLLQKNEVLWIKADLSILKTMRGFSRALTIT
ncbi:hypothetical protein C2S52_017901 [Perilla frutescens var. hirtella]|nr:hypothetical protein C2S52_017901 [Perilla frutescens var. hirtella]